MTMLMIMIMTIVMFTNIIIIIILSSLLSVSWIDLLQQALVALGLVGGVVARPPEDLRDQQRGDHHLRRLVVGAHDLLRDALYELGEEAVRAPVDEHHGALGPVGRGHLRDALLPADVREAVLQLLGVVQLPGRGPDLLSGNENIGSAQGRA